MSGESFNFICFNLTSDKVFGHISDLEDMYNYIKDDKELDLVANELQAYIKYLYDTKLKVDKNGDRLFEVIRAIQYRVSADTGKDDVLKAQEEMKALMIKCGWLKVGVK